MLNHDPSLYPHDYDSEQPSEPVLYTYRLFCILPIVFFFKREI